MHVPDGYLSTPTSATTAAVAVMGLAWAVRRVRSRPDDADGVPLVGLVTMFVFAAQMINFGVGSGTSGHLMGGALAAVLLGPSLAIVCMSAVLAVQALVFADGGVGALGTNVVLMALVGVLVGWAVSRIALLRHSSAPWGVAMAGAAGAFVSVPTSALVFAGLYAVGGHHDVPFLELAGDMVRTHVAIGFGEAVITGIVVAAVAATRPDLVLGVRRPLVHAGVR